MILRNHIYSVDLNLTKNMCFFAFVTLVNMSVTICLNANEVHSFKYDQSINQFGPDQARRSVGRDLGPNGLQKLSADDSCR